jgi:hypothetical protein
MSHSHLGARHLLTQIETDRSRRGNRDKRPEWLRGFVEEAAGSFEPLSGVARVGYECLPAEGGWEISLYLGSIELVGGKSDGRTERPDFRCDLKRLLKQFTRIDDLEWTVWPDGIDEANREFRSVMRVDGLVGTSQVCLRILSSAPQALSPGLHQFADGRVEAV